MLLMVRVCYLVVVPGEAGIHRINTAETLSPPDLGPIGKEPG